MDYYAKLESFRNGVSIGGKGTIVFEAVDLLDAMRKTADMIESSDPTPRAMEPGVEDRITIGRCVEIPAT